MGWIKRLLFWKDDDTDEVEEEFDEDSIPADDDASEPRPGHVEILARVRRDAEADAIRHAEDMLNRDFPIVGEAEGIAEGRLAELKVSYSDQRGDVLGRIRNLEGVTAEARSRLEASERALANKGVPENQLEIPPLRAPRPFPERAVIGIGGAVVLIALVALLDLQGQWVAPLTAAAIVAFALALALPPGPYLEDPEIAALREARLEQEEVLSEFEEKLRAARGGLAKLEERTYSSAELEVKFATEVVGTYKSTVFSSLPAGVLEDGREIKDQRRPRVQLPPWTSRLTGAE